MLKELFYRTANAVFAKIGRVAYSAIKSKCLPVLLYGLKACPLINSHSSSLAFVINRFFIKLFTTKSTETVKYC